MEKIGRKNRLTVSRKIEFGVYLVDIDLGEVLLPKRYVPENCEVGDELDVFIYTDSEDRLVATTEIPYVMRDEVAYLKVISVTNFGAFVDWGLPKDLFVPLGEQKTKLVLDRSYLVYVSLDEETERLIGSTKLSHRYLKESDNFIIGEAVRFIIAEENNLGYGVIIEGTHWGMLFRDDIFQKINIGDQIDGFIKRIREDKKIDLSLRKPGYGAVSDYSQIILDKLSQAGGFLPTTDKSSPEDIYHMFQMSKKMYKQSVGALYRKKIILIENDGIRLLDKNS